MVRYAKPSMAKTGSKKKRKTIPCFYPKNPNTIFWFLVVIIVFLFIIRFINISDALVLISLRKWGVRGRREQRGGGVRERGGRGGLKGEEGEMRDGSKL